MIILFLKSKIVNKRYEGKRLSIEILFLYIRTYLNIDPAFAFMRYTYGKGNPNGIFMTYKF